MPHVLKVLNLVIWGTFGSENYLLPQQLTHGAKSDPIWNLIDTKDESWKEKKNKEQKENFKNWDLPTPTKIGEFQKGVSIQRHNNPCDAISS